MPYQLDIPATPSHKVTVIFDYYPGSPGSRDVQPDPPETDIQQLWLVSRTKAHPPIDLFAVFNALEIDITESSTILEQCEEHAIEQLEDEREAAEEDAEDDRKLEE